MDQISREYVRIAFAIEHYVEGFVDAYFGPPEYKQVEPIAPSELASSIAALRREVQTSDYPALRKSYLEAQLRAMETTARKLSGEEISYTDEVRLLFDIEPTHTPEYVFEETNAQLDAALPGSGSISERLANWRQQFEVTPEIARQMIDRIAGEARRRTADLVTLPDDEGVEFALVSDKPWSGYNWYLGNMRSLVEINTDLPIRANALLDLVCHEAYPGHHTEHSIKERDLFLARGWGEQAIQLINTPVCVVSEGIATLAAEIIFGAEAGLWAAENLYPLAGISGDPEREQQIAAAAYQQRALNGNAALLLHDAGASPDEVVAYIMRYGLRTEREARQTLRFISTPLWRAYTFTYFSGRQLLRNWFEQGDARQRFRTLLTEQVTPSQIAIWSGRV